MNLRLSFHAEQMTMISEASFEVPQGAKWFRLALPERAGIVFDMAFLEDPQEFQKHGYIRGESEMMEGKTRVSFNRVKPDDNKS